MTRVKIKLSYISKTKRYTVEELAKAIKVTPQAIYWRINHMDLPCLDIKGVKKIYGREFVEHVKEWRQKHKFSEAQKRGKFYCLREHKKVKPLNNEIKIVPLFDSESGLPNGRIKLVATCPICKKSIYLMSNITQKEKYESEFNLIPD